MARYRFDFDAPAFRVEMEAVIRRDIKLLAKQSCLVGVDAEYWDVSRISWDGSEWPGLRKVPGICYVEAFEHSNPPHDFVFVVTVESGSPRNVATFEGDLDFFALTIFSPDAEVLELPEQIPRN
jgi:hypothetical protein